MNKKLRILGFTLCLLTILTVGYSAISGLAGAAAGPREVSDYVLLDKEVVEAAKSIPLQDHGRIKPLQTWAETNMLAMHGERGMTILKDGEKVKISSTEWLLTVIFKPEVADTLPTFRIDNSHILEDLDMDIKGLRERYSFNDFTPKQLDKLEKIFAEINAIDVKRRNDRQKQMVSLYTNLTAYQSLKNPFAFSKKDIEHHGKKSVTAIFDRNAKMLQAANDPANVLAQIRSIIITEGEVLRRMTPSGLGRASKLNFFPPEDLKNDEWTSAGKEFSKSAIPNYRAYLNFVERFYQVEDKRQNDPNSLTPEDSLIRILETTQNNSQVRPYSKVAQKHIRDLEALQSAFDTNDANLQLAGIHQFKGKYASLMEKRGETTHITSEVKYNDTRYFNNSIALVILAFILVLIRCVFIGRKVGKWFYWASYAFASISCLIVIAGIIHRSLIMGRPPVGNLYDTMPFIVGACLLILLLLELIHRKSVLLAVATLLGIAGLILAKSYETSQASDQLSPLVAVLKSNFWLTYHVITITLGYAGCLMASAISLVYVLGRVFGIIENREDRKYLTMNTYGILGFTLLFSLIGTVLGGIWAADSWGRFWGWDPKENGALLIVIWMLAILHARAGGYIREMGVHCASIFAGIVVVFSWWHVNFLGVGLHNYGFTDDSAMNLLYVFYGLLILTIIAGIIYSIVEKDRKKMDKLRKAAYDEQQLQEAVTVDPTLENPYQ